MPISSDEITQVDAQLDDHPRIVRESKVSVPQITGGPPIELKHGRHEGDLRILFHGVDHVARLIEVRVEDLQTGVELLQSVERREPDA